MDRTPHPADTAASTERSQVSVRDSDQSDLAAIQGIYAHHVLTGLASFEESPPPTKEEMRLRRETVLRLGLPHLVATMNNQVVGYCHASPYRPRSAYRFTIEDSVYVAAGLEGRGIGSALLGHLVACSGHRPWRQILAVIGNSENAGSIALHRRMGFDTVGTFRSVGFKFGRWVDSVLMQRPLGDGDLTLPPA